jgi:hypothetical protein
MPWREQAYAYPPGMLERTGEGSLPVRAIKDPFSVTLGMATYHPATRLSLCVWDIPMKRREFPTEFLAPAPTHRHPRLPPFSHGVISGRYPATAPCCFHENFRIARHTPTVQKRTTGLDLEP